MPRSSRIGLAAMAVGWLADVAVHAAAGMPEARVHPPGAAEAHALTFAGMVLVLAGVVRDGVRRTSVRRPPTEHPS